MNAELQQSYERLQEEGQRLAGGLDDLPQRAAVYHHVFHHSRQNHTFPVIAAHGALWAKGYFQAGLRLSRLLSCQYVWNRATQRRQLQALDTFADQFRDINRRVCVDTYANYHFTAKHGEHPGAAHFIPLSLLEPLNMLHAARRAGRVLTTEEQRRVFAAHFLHEQEHVVGPTLERAVSDFSWPLVKFVALKPFVRFRYFPRGQALWFRNFACREERIEHGLRAFEFAAAAGWDHVQETLREYAVMPRTFFSEPAEYFSGLRETILGGQPLLS